MSTNTQAKTGWEEWRALASRGHEIGNHSATHPNLNAITNHEQLVRETEGASQTIASRLGTAPLSFAYPFCKKNAESEALVMQHHRVARMYTPTFEGNGSSDPARKSVENAISNRAWHVHLTHRIGARMLEEHLQYLQTVTNRTWVDTYGTVGRYERERNKARVETARREPSKLVFRVMIDDPGFPVEQRVPLTVRLTPPPSATAPLRAMQGNRPLPVTPSQDRVLVDVIPGDEPVTVEW